VLSFSHRRVHRLHAGFHLFIDVCAAFTRTFHFTFENLILNYSFYLKLCMCVLELFALGLGAGVVDVVCLSKC
jgi:hypothetical protein